MENVEVSAELTSPSLGNRFGKMLVATVATFVATALAEKAYDAVVAARQNKTTES